MRTERNKKCKIEKQQEFTLNVLINLYLELPKSKLQQQFKDFIVHFIMIKRIKMLDSHALSYKNIGKEYFKIKKEKRLQKQ